MKNVLAKDRTVNQVCNEILRGSAYPAIAKQLARQLKIALRDRGKHRKKVNTKQ